MKEEMFKQAKQIMQQAYSPYSKFKVGTCLRTTNNNLYVGCNVENASYSLTHCAESGAIMSMIAAGEKQIAEIVIVGSGDFICTPCGACRQRIREFAALDIAIHMFSYSGEHNTMTLQQLLPESFGPEHLSRSS